MIDRRTQVMSWLEGLAQDDWHMYHSDSEVQEIAKTALELLEEQDNCENCAIAIEDRQSVVLCKDCKHYKPNRLFECSLHGACQPKPEWFCADGERR